MKINGKRILSIITYYTLLGLAIIMACSTIVYAINRTGIPGWTGVIFVIWSIAVIGTMVFDIICTSLKRMKYISGIIVYVLSVTSLVVTAVLYLVRAGLATGLPTAFMPVFTGIAALVLSTSLYMIAAYIVGEAVVEHASAMKSIKRNQSQQ